MKILVRGANWIGDAVMTIPALREVRRLFPDDEITLYTRSWAEGVFRDAEFVDRIVKIRQSDTRFKSIVEEANRLRAEKYDLAILFPNSFESAVVVRLAGIPRRFGYSRDGRGILLTDPIKPPKWKDERHQIHYYLNVIGEIEKRIFGTDTVMKSEPASELAVSEMRIAEAAKLLDEAGVDVSKPIVALGAGSTNSVAKRWGEERFAELGAMLQNNLDANVVLLGSRDEVEISSRVSALSDADIVDLTGKTDLADVTAILARADLFISNDMGLAHIAAAVGTKTIVIFGPTNDVTTRPFGINAEVIRHDVECSPCMLRICPIDHRCMTRIGADEVFERAKMLLEIYQ